MQNHILADAIAPVVGNATSVSPRPLLTCGATYGINGASYINLFTAAHRIQNATVEAALHVLLTGSCFFHKGDRQ